MIDGRTLRRGNLAKLPAIALAAALVAGPANAAPRDFAAWVRANTDLLPSQIAITGPDVVYALQPSGPGPVPGEVTALVRTEALADDWKASHGFQSWEANLLIDCRGGRVRIVRSASYPQRDRQGQPVPGAADAGWSIPKPGEPAARLVAAACDPGFAWPLRPASAATSIVAPAAPTGAKLADRKTAAAPAAPATPAGGVDSDSARPRIEELAPAAVTSASAGAGASVQVAAGGGVVPVPPPKPGSVEQVVEISSGASEADAGLPTTRKVVQPFAIQLGRGPSETGARKAVERARAILGGQTGGLTPSVEASEIDGGRRRFTATLSGFATQDLAQAACEALQKAQQPCLVRQPSAPVEGRDGGHEGAYYIQVARGPSEEGARKALDKARRALGPATQGLLARMDASDVSGLRRYTVRFEGFASADAAKSACDLVLKAGQSCYFRPMPDDAGG